MRVRERAREACVCIEKKRELYVKTVVTEKTARTKRLYDKETESRIVRGFYLCRSNFYTILAACQSEKFEFSLTGRSRLSAYLDPELDQEKLILWQPLSTDARRDDLKYSDHLSL